VAIFGRPFVKRFALSYRSVVLSVCTVCDIGVLWPNGWMDQDETWHAGRPRPWPRCVRWGPTFPPLKGHSPQFSAHTCCGQMAGCIKMPLDMEVGLSPGDFLLDGNPAPTQKGAEPPIYGPRLLWTNGCMGQDATWYRCKPRPTRHCVRWGPSSPPLKGHSPQFRPVSVVAKRLDGLRCHVVWR